MHYNIFLAFTFDYDISGDYIIKLFTNVNCSVLVKLEFSSLSVTSILV
jgi:hypothetical protein